MKLFSSQLKPTECVTLTKMGHGSSESFTDLVFSLSRLHQPIKANCLPTEKA